VLLMGDISTEPSMEEILSSIKRIIAEEGDAAVATRARRAGKPATTITAVPAPVADPVDEDDDEILELTDPQPQEQPEAEVVAQPEPQPVIQQTQPAPMPIGAPDAPHRPRAEPRPETIVSDRAMEATRGPLEALSKIVVKPEVTGTDTLEGLVRELLKPMLRDWLDANLPQVVEAMVAREIARITGR
jgi:cell pole-organizing protein PopZ